MRNILFVCSRNQWRSPTAEQVWRRHPELKVRSAGTSSKARKTIGPTDLCWADIILVMEDKHKHRLTSEYGRLLQHKQIHVLDIPDEYQYMDPELVEILQISVASILELTNF
ncbi:phosphotyrosine protein phosphatase [Hahella sp. KA22]|uniref:low molecular weight protein tyrosine phosphatase family protein n=1 Tax=Hahella sp. KA22 TaxID=1628392 RepID=UPI000FDE1D4D|nr:phosphotyrosine protein phosphatase [Hahella sp. KA22]AZZ89970.1 phosphotyrosine protein phosphatase [Hahella sp. KA22]QAY53339.1 phosphotyrosine protein phosphatase [Hahella sp. KA22]